MDDQYNKDNSEKENSDFDPSQDEAHNDEFSEFDDQPQEDEISESELNSSGQWVKEILENTDEEDNAVLEDLHNLPVKQGDLPDWINTLSQADENEQISDEYIEADHETPDAIRFKSMDDSWDTEEDIEKNIQNEESEAMNEIVQPDEGFVEISQFDLEASDNLEKSEFGPNQPAEEQEELPDWLEEMIGEPETETSESIEYEDEKFNPDEATKPVIVSSIETEHEDIDEEQSFEAAPLTTDLSMEEKEVQITEEALSDEEFIEETLIGDEAAEDLPIWEEETPPIEMPSEEESLLEHAPAMEEKEVQITEEALSGEEFIEETLIGDEPAEDLPIVEAEAPQIEMITEEESLLEDAPPLYIENKEEIDADEGDWHEEELLSPELPKTLKFAKYLLDQGEIEPSFEIFQTYVKKSEHLEEIKIWAKEAASTDKEKSNLLWELIGDLSLKQDKPDEALSAYTRAISKLIRK